MEIILLLLLVILIFSGDISGIIISGDISSGIVLNDPVIIGGCINNNANNNRVYFSFKISVEMFQQLCAVPGPLQIFFRKRNWNSLLFNHGLPGEGKGGQCQGA